MIMEKQERDQRYKELGLRDKITLSSGRFLLGNKYASLLLDKFNVTLVTQILFLMSILVLPYSIYRDRCLVFGMQTKTSSAMVLYLYKTFSVFIIF